MKKLLLSLLILPLLAIGGPNDMVVNQRNPTDTGQLTKLMLVPTTGSSGIWGYNVTTRTPTFYTPGAGLTLTGTVLDVAAQSWASITGKPSFSPVATSGLYSDLTGSPVLSVVATTGDYADLTGKPTIPDAQVNADWLSSSGVSQILNKPSLATVATSGAYADLTGKPTIPSAQVNTDWNAGSGVAQLLNKPTTLAGYGITDGVTQTALTSALSSYATTSALTSGLATKFNQPAGTTAQYIRGDGSLAALPVARRIETYNGTTNASGQITVTYPTAYPSTPSVQPPAPAQSNQVWTTVISTASGFTLQLNQRNTVNLLAVEVMLAATVPVNGVSATILVVSQ